MNNRPPRNNDMKKAINFKLLLLIPLIAVAAGLSLSEQEGMKSALKGTRPNEPKDRRLSSTMVENLALINKEIIPLAELANFSVQLLLRSTADRAAILKLNRAIKSEATSQYRGAKLNSRPRSQEELGKFINNGYWSLRSPDLVRVQITQAGLKVLAPTGPLIWPLKQKVALPVVIANELEKRATVDLQSRIAQQSRRLELLPQETRGYFLNCLPHRVGKETEFIDLYTEVGRVSIPIAMEIRNVGDLKVDFLDENGTPTAIRVYVTGSDGMMRAPEGAFLRIVGGDYNQPYSGDGYFYAEGSFKLRLPEGKAVIEAARGFEYEFVRHEVAIVADKPRTLAVHLKRPINMAQRGWYSGETHIHANLINNEIITPEDVWLQVRGEDLNVANLFVSNSVQGKVHDRKYFEGRPHRLSQGNTILYWNEEMRNFGLYGHIGFLNLKTLVDPLYTGFSETPWWEDYPANYVQAVKAKAQGAVVTAVHPHPGAGFGEIRQEYPIDLALGAMDALDVMSQVDEQAVANVWYKLLNCGFRCAISAGTDSFLNVMYHLVPGANRLYVQVGSQLTYEKWIEGYKQGKSFATNGPLLFFTVNGKLPGEEIRLPAQPGSVQIEAEAFSQVPMERLEIVVNGQVVASTPAITNNHMLKISARIALERSSWVAARVSGPGHRLVPNDLLLFAHSSPVYCYLGNEKISSKKDAEFFVDWIERLIVNLQNQGTFSDPAHKEEIIQLFRKGQQVYRSIAAGVQM